MKKILFRSPYRFVFIPLMAAAFLSLISFAVMQLWNNLLPAILHITTITFWQAMGVFILCKLLFGFGRGGRFGRGGPWGREGMGERFNNMTPEQRMKFKERFGNHRCNNRGRHGWGNWPEETEPAKPQDEEAD